MESNQQRMSELLERYRGELASVDPAILGRPNVVRARVVELTQTSLHSFQVVEPELDNEFSTVRAAERRAQIKTLEERALVYFAADLAREENASTLESRRAEIARAVSAHDRYLSKWAWPLFAEDPELEIVLVDIRRGRGVQDDAEDVLRLVELYRSQWTEAAGQTPITEDYLATAEADATELITLLRRMPIDGARDLAWRAFALWRSDYSDIISAGRYIMRGDTGAEAMFPGIGNVRSPAARPPAEPVDETPDGIPEEPVVGETPESDSGEPVPTDPGVIASESASSAA